MSWILIFDVIWLFRISNNRIQKKKKKIQSKLNIFSEQHLYVLNALLVTIVERQLFLPVSHSSSSSSTPFVVYHTLWFRNLLCYFNTSLISSMRLYGIIVVGYQTTAAAKGTFGCTLRSRIARRSHHTLLLLLIIIILLLLQMVVVSTGQTTAA